MAVIPARLESKRLAKKPLQLINHKPLIVYVAEEVERTGVFKHIYVATDSKEVFNLFKGHSVKAIMTSVKHQSGTDRINEAISKVHEDFDTVFNVQGDEPFIYKQDLLNLKNSLEMGLKMISLYEEIKPQDIKDENKVKVILNNQNEAIYFSRFGIPFSKKNALNTIDSKFVGKHIGVYAYEKNFLKSFCAEPMGHHETFEKLEQLRALQMGEKVKMILTRNTYQSVDTMKDLKKVNEILNLNKKNKIEDKIR